MAVTKTCQECGGTFKVPPVRADTAKFCSIRCAAPHRYDGKGKHVFLTCAACGCEFKVPLAHKERRKYCSYRCKHGDWNYRASISRRFAGSKNPQWLGGRVRHSSGYYCVAAPHHPFESNGYVLEHRLVMERWLREHDPESRFLIKLGEQKYLSPDYHVHHKDESRSNNAIENLVCMTPSEHQRHHNAERRKT